MLLLESTTIVKSLESIEPLWDPLYTRPPIENCQPISRLMTALRDKYKESVNCKKSEYMTNIMLKVTNQVVIVCRRYLNVDGTFKILKQEPSLIMEKTAVSTLNGEERFWFEKNRFVKIV